MTTRCIATAAVLAFSLTACGGGGGSAPAPAASAAGPGPAPAVATISVRGTATASTSTYFQLPVGSAPANAGTPVGSGTGRSGLWSLSTSTAIPAPWDCTDKYAVLFAALPKDVDSNKDGVADTNITSAGVVTYNVDVKGDRSQNINIGSAANIATMLNKDAQCLGTPSLNIDRDNNGIADTDVDADGDGKSDYSLVDGSAVTVAGATVVMTNTATGEIFNAVSGRDGKFELAGLKTGRYQMIIRAKDPSGKTIWNHTREQVVTSSGDIGVFALSRHPILLSVTIDGELRPLGTNVNSITYSDRKLKAGDVVSIKILAEDPNGAAITMQPFYHAATGAAPLQVSGHNISYTVSEADLALNILQIGADLNNDDGRFGMDAHRDLFVSVTYKMEAGITDAPPAYHGVVVNGVTYANPSPLSAMSITTAPVDDGAPIDFTVKYDTSNNAKISTQVVDYSHGVRGSHGFNTASFQIPGSVTKGVYSVEAWVFASSATGKGNYNNVYLPVKTSEKPAKLSGLLVNGKPYRDQLLRIGDVMTAEVQATDPLGLPLQYLFNLVGTKAQIHDGWTPNNTLRYTITDQDTAAEFAVRVFIRNNDSRVRSDIGADDSATFPVKVTL